MMIVGLVKETGLAGTHVPLRRKSNSQFKWEHNLRESLKVSSFKHEICVVFGQGNHGVYSARRFVEWYNGLPASSNVSLKHVDFIFTFFPLQKSI